MKTVQEIEKIPMVFIIGKGRSGTSLLQAIFNASPNVITANESAFIIYLKQKYAPIKQWTEAAINEFITDLYKDKKFALLWEIDRTLLTQKIKSYPVHALNFWILCKLVYLEASSPFPKADIQLIVDKNPLYSFFIKELMTIFPDAKFIHIIRDYRDNIISTRKAFKVNDIATIAQRWKKQNQLIEKFKRKHEARFYTLQYEKLANDPKTSVSQICSFTGINFTPAMLDFHKTTSKVYSKENPVINAMTEIVQDIHLNLLNPINTDRIDKWKTELSDKEVELIDYITGSYAKTYGYMPTTRVFRFRFILNSIKSNSRYYLNYSLYKLYFCVPVNLRDKARALFQRIKKKLGFNRRHPGMDIKDRTN